MIKLKNKEKVVCIYDEENHQIIQPLKIPVDSLRKGIYPGVFKVSEKMLEKGITSKDVFDLYEVQYNNYK